MSEKERLVELLQNCQIQTRTLEDLFYKSVIEKIADHLLENGIIVPPVKVGDTVYGISRGAIIPIDIDRIQYSKRGIDILGRNEQYYGYGTITLHPDNEFGIEWYTTKEQAEKALKGGKGMKSLEELAQQIKDILNAEYNPHCAVVITVDSVKVVSVEHSTPL